MKITSKITLVGFGIRYSIMKIGLGIHVTGQPFGTFPKIHPFWRRHPSLYYYYYYYHLLLLFIIKQFLALWAAYGDFSMSSYLSFGIFAQSCNTLIDDLDL